MKYLIAALLAFGMTGAALAEFMTAEQLLRLDAQVRQRGDVNTATFLTGYVTGVFDAAKGPVHCVRENAVTVAQVLQAVRDDPSLHKGSADVAVATVLQRMAGPCKTGGNQLPQGKSI
jgi:hypothetical protein